MNVKVKRKYENTEQTRRGGDVHVSVGHHGLRQRLEVRVTDSVGNFLCVIGIPDSYKMQKVKAFVVLKPEYQPSEEVWLQLMAYCKKHVAKYAMPCDIEFRDSLPTTLVGKVAYRILEEEELAKIANMSEEERNQPDRASLMKDKIAKWQNKEVK